MTERYPGGHNPSLDDGFVVVEPATYADDFVCTCKVCGQVFRSKPQPAELWNIPYGGGRYESIEPLWNHRDAHKVRP